ncbi:MAG: hypothetical protein JRN15_20500 [Nitrososphaerota archaeon]|nr:hypothetical protein [Nitrososphaerota archaeon]
MTLFDPNDFYLLACSLSNSGIYDEAKGRTSVGRAYYACFLAAREQLKSKGFNFNGDEKDHSLIKTYLGQMQRSNLSHKISSLRRLRNDADYELSLIIREKDCQNACITAGNILNEIDLL